MLEIGSRLSERYRVDAVLGKGGMGAVYLGRLESLGNKPVAIKEMELGEGCDRDQDLAIHQFQREATFLAHLDHPNLVKVTDFFAENGKHYLVMDYVEGETLQQRLERIQRPMTWEELRFWADSLAQVLHYLHSLSPPILFRDLKPANIMIQRDGRLKLIDFGIARTATPGTETSTFLKGTGTNGFSPIEQYGMGESTDQRSDIYAYGATLYYLLTGRIPPEAVGRVSTGAVLVPPSKLAPDIPLGMDQILTKCLAVKQSDRYPAIIDVARYLRGLDSAVPGSQCPSVQTTTANSPAITLEMYPSAKREPSSTPWAVAVAVLGLAAAATAGLFFQHVSKTVASQATPTPAAVVMNQKSAPYPISVGASDNPVMPKNRVIYSDPSVRSPEYPSRMSDPSDLSPPIKEIRITTNAISQPANEVQPVKKKTKTIKASLGGDPKYPTASKKPSEPPAADAPQSSADDYRSQPRHPGERIRANRPRLNRARSTSGGYKGRYIF
jgi:serine/threonine protein kinase, bacterial